MTTKIHYVEVEVCLNKDNKPERITGLFAGIPVRSLTKDKKDDPRFVRLFLGSKTTLFCSMANYSVVSIKTSYAKSNRQSFYKADAAEQEQAMESLKKLLITLREEKMADSSGAVSLDKYTNIPIKYDAKSQANKGTVSGVVTNNTSKKPLTTQTKSATVHTGPKTVVAKDIKEVTYIRRRTKKPSEEFLAKMRKKVVGLANETYDPIPLAEDESPRQSYVEYDDDEYGGAMGGYYGRHYPAGGHHYMD